MNFPPTRKKKDEPHLYDMIAFRLSHVLVIPVDPMLVYFFGLLKPLCKFVPLSLGLKFDLDIPQLFDQVSGVLWRLECS